MGESATEPRPTFIGLDPKTTICSSGLKNLYITGILLRILQSHFSRSENITFERLRDLIWTPQPEDTDSDSTSGPDTKIVIDPTHLWNAQNVQQRPSIMVKRNRVSTQRLGLDDGWTLGLNPDREGDYKTRMIIGSHTCFCIGGSGAEAEMVGQEVFDELMEFSPVIRKDFLFHRFTVTEISEVNKLEESDEHFVAAVVVGWAHSQDWRIVQEAPFLKTLEIALQPADC